MAFHSPMPFAIRWRNVRQRRRCGVIDCFVDAIYLLTGFHI